MSNEDETENNDGKIESVENTQKVRAKIINSKDGREFTLEGKQQDIDGLKEVMVSATEAYKENQRLKEEKIQNPASFGAPLNSFQTGEKINLDSNEGLPVDFMTFENESDMVNQLEKQNTPESRKALNDLLLKSTKTSWSLNMREMTRRHFIVSHVTKQKRKILKQKGVCGVIKNEPIH